MRKRGGPVGRCCKRVSRLVGHDLAGKLIDVIFFLIFFLSFPFVPRGRSNRPSGTFRHPSTRFSSRLLVWGMKSRHRNQSGSEISAGFASTPFSFVFHDRPGGFFLSVFDSPRIPSDLASCKATTTSGAASTPGPQCCYRRCSWKT